MISLKTDNEIPFLTNQYCPVDAATGKHARARSRASQVSTHPMRSPGPLETQVVHRSAWRILARGVTGCPGEESQP